MKYNSASLLNLVLYDNFNDLFNNIIVVFIPVFVIMIALVKETVNEVQRVQAVAT